MISYFSDSLSDFSDVQSGLYICFSQAIKSGFLASRNIIMMLKPRLFGLHLALRLQGKAQTSLINYRDLLKIILSLHVATLAIKLCWFILIKALNRLCGRAGCSTFLFLGDNKPIYSCRGPNGNMILSKLEKFGSI